MKRPRSMWVLLLGGLLIAAQPVRADRLHLEGGGVIDTDRWWMDGDTLMYESIAGTVGIPRALVLRIEKASPSAAPGSQGAVQPPTGDNRAPSAQPRSGLGQGDPEERQRALELFTEGKAGLEKRDFESASARFLEAVRNDPDLSAARVGYALSEMALSRDGLALSLVLEGLSRDPKNAELHELLGDLRNREERVEDAVRSWRTAFSIAPNDRLRDKITKGERELQVGRDFAFSTTSHFNVRYDSEVDLDLASAVMDYLEEQYWVLADRFRHAPAQPITVLLYPKQQFRDVTQSPDSVGGLYDGKIRVPLGGLRQVDPRARGVLVHELTHAVVHSKTRGNCPRWLHEGLAQLAEGRELGPADLKAVSRLVGQGDPASWESRGFSYAAALAFTRYLESRRGFYGLVDLLDHLGAGETVDAALERVYGEDYSGLCHRWARERFGEERQ